MQVSNVSQQIEGATRVTSDTRRLYYLDWLRVIAILGVFLFHASNVFNTAGFEIKNSEQSEAITIIEAFFFPWGMPLFFLIAGAGTWFALRRRSAGQFTRERTLRLLVPFFVGTLLLGPIQLYLSWRHKVQTGVFDGSVVAFVADRFSIIGPRAFGAAGYHMWFLGYLFAFSLLALPFFLWLRGEAGRRTVSSLASLCEHRGAILLFILPLAAVRMGLQPLFPEEHHWADFFTFGVFFVLGYLLFADGRFAQAIRRDWPILLGVGTVFFLGATAIGMSLESFSIEMAPRTPLEFLFWGLVAACGWCWTAFMLFIGMRFLDRCNRGLQYGQEAILPFFVIHQPVIIVIAFFVVQWSVDIWPKMLVVFVGSFLVSIGIVELLIKRVGTLRVLFGMKGGQVVQAQAAKAPQKIHADSASVR
jgi:surface polysaccharide O-acyltransferase-like enzyme